MSLLSRRAFVFGSAAGAALPAEKAFAQQVPRSGYVDVVVVGAGAAGIAASRKLVATGKRVVLLEASSQIGGRCVTDTNFFRVPYDRGARSIYWADVNPLARLAPQAGLTLYPAPPGQRMRIGRRYAREGEMEDFLANLVRANAAIADAARKSDMACAQALPKDIAEWRSTIDFILGAYGCGKDLSEVSTADLSRAGERDNGVFCRQGLGTLLARLVPAGILLPSTPATRIRPAGNIEVETAQGLFRAEAAIVTVSTNILTSGKLKFDLPKRQLDAASKLKLGTRDRVVLEMPGNPLGLRADELVFEKSDAKQTAALFANVYGSSLCMVDVGGSFGRELSAKGETSMVEFAVNWLSGLYGSDVKARFKRSHVTRWSEEPWVLGSISAAAPGAQPSRKILTEPISGRIFLAGEATHETLWGTVGGAWESGERAADSVIRLIGGGRRR
jgi:monoamine oxidase